MVTKQESVGEGVDLDPIRGLMCHATGKTDVSMGLEALVYAKSNKRSLTCVFMQEVWNKLGQLQAVDGFTVYSPGQWALRGTTIGGGGEDMESCS